MTKVMLDYTKSILERVSFDPALFYKKIKKAIKTLLPHEMDQLKEWLYRFTHGKPELKPCLVVINS